MSVGTIDKARCVIYDPSRPLLSQLQDSGTEGLKPFLFAKCGFVVFIKASWYHHCSIRVNGMNLHSSMFFMLPGGIQGQGEFPLTQVTSCEVVITRVHHEVLRPTGDLRQLEHLEAYNKAFNDADLAVRSDVIKILQTQEMKDVIEHKFSHGGGDHIPLRVCAQLLDELTIAELQCANK